MSSAAPLPWVRKRKRRVGRLRVRRSRRCALGLGKLVSDIFSQPCAAALAGSEGPRGVDLELVSAGSPGCSWRPGCIASARRLIICPASRIGRRAQLRKHHLASFFSRGKLGFAPEDMKSWLRARAGRAWLTKTAWRVPVEIPPVDNADVAHPSSRPCTPCPAPPQPRRAQGAREC